MANAFKAGFHLIAHRARQVSAVAQEEKPAAVL